VAGEEVGRGVRGSNVGVAVGGTGVGTVNPGLVGGKVEVTKRDGAVVAVSFCESVMQDVKKAETSRVRSVVFFIRPYSITQTKQPPFQGYGGCSIV